LDFLTDNPILLLSLLGAALALAASLTSTVSKKPPVRVMAILTVLGFLVVVAQQLISAALDAQSAADQKVADQAREEIIQAIQDTVDRTEGVVTSINDRLSGKALSSLGDELIAVAASDDTGGEDVRARSKESASAWFSYARWVEENRRTSDARLCLNLELNAGRNYRLNMILGYLLTGPGTEEQLSEHFERGTWDAIPSQGFVDDALLTWPGVDCVLVYEGPVMNGDLIAYARARDFALELLLQQRAGRGDDVEALLNRRGPPSMAALDDTFGSLRTSILRTDDVDMLVQTMIDKQWPEIVASSSTGQFLLSLERVVRTAAQEEALREG
jgi:hypothetical protein